MPGTSLWTPKTTLLDAWSNVGRLTTFSNAWLLTWTPTSSVGRLVHLFPSPDKALSSLYELSFEIFVCELLWP